MLLSTLSEGGSMLPSWEYLSRYISDIWDAQWKPARHAGTLLALASVPMVSRGIVRHIIIITSG